MIPGHAKKKLVIKALHKRVMDSVFRADQPMPAGMFTYPPFNPAVSGAWQPPASGTNWTAILVFLLIGILALQVYVTFIQPTQAASAAAYTSELPPAAPATSQELIEQGYDP